MHEPEPPPKPPGRGRAATLGALDQWMGTLKGLPPGITVAEEQELALRIQQGDDQAMERLVAGSLRFAVSIAKRYQHRGLSLPDLVQEANFGLVIAARKFDPARGVKFMSYAVWWIRQYILIAIAHQGRSMRVPARHQAEMHALAAAHQRLVQRTHADPAPDAVATEAGIDPDRARGLIAALVAPVRLDAPADDHPGSLYSAGREEGVADHSALFLETLDAERRNVRLRKRLAASLNPREFKVIELYYGLDGGGGATLEEIGGELGVTRERVRQIKHAALEKLREDVVLREYSHAAA